MSEVLDEVETEVDDVGKELILQKLSLKLINMITFIHILQFYKVLFFLKKFDTIYSNLL